MVKSKSGKMHPNAQLAMAADRRGGHGMPAPMAPKMEGAGEPKMSDEGGMDGGHMQIHDHGDGSFHTVSKDGEQTEHPHIGHMLMHVAHHHAPEHGHTHHMHMAEGGHTSHHVGQDGEVQGPHDAANLEELKGNMDQFLGEEEHEGHGMEGGGAAQGGY